MIDIILAQKSILNDFKPSIHDNVMRAHFILYYNVVGFFFSRIENFKYDQKTFKFLKKYKN